MAVASPAVGHVARAMVAVLTGLVLMAGNASAGLAAPKPSVKQLKKELAALSKESDRLIEEYYNGRRAQQQAERTEKAARERLAAAQEVYDRESLQLRTLAVAQYIGGEPNQVALFTASEDPDGLLRRLALSRHLIDVQDARLRGYAQVRDERRKAEEEAAARSEELGTAVADLERRKEKAEKLIERIRDRIDELYTAPGVRRPDGTWVPQLPDGSENITPRMRLVKTLIKERFAVPMGIGCYRTIQDGGEHPLGRACDFMLSHGGAMPSPAEVKRGYEIANWAIKNSRRLGIMYIIYRQRIWHSRTGTWRTMSNRGGTTANHFDHPHISVY
ncbi:coiled-coil domain-containing protein [Nonomuraea sp. NPDC051191]|uniref:coiled-coil domain-containing protein n=1 Tax=Nonomuraea sp. NPDC051191 TaxID=3364372 RepID=UPI0037B21428